MFSERRSALELAVEAGVTMLRAGGEIGRVEDTIGHMARAFDVRQVNAYATPTGIIVTGETGDGDSHTMVRRVPSVSNDLSIVAAVNDLSRRCARRQLTLQAAWDELQTIKHGPAPYAPVILVGAAGIAAATAANLFGGSVYDMLGAGISGIIVQFAMLIIAKRVDGVFARSWAGGALAACCALLLHRLFPQVTVDYSIAGAIIPLVPGVAITNALRDIIGGQLVSGVARAAEAAAIGIAVAAGVGIVLSIISL